MKANTKPNKEKRKMSGWQGRHAARSSLLLIMTQLFPSLVWTAPCPAETPLYGGATLDGSPDEIMTYFAVDDDDQTIMTGMEYCT